MAAAEAAEEKEDQVEQVEEQVEEVEVEEQVEEALAQLSLLWLAFVDQAFPLDIYSFDVNRQPPLAPTTRSSGHVRRSPLPKAILPANA